MFYIHIRVADLILTVIFHQKNLTCTPVIGYSYKIYDVYKAYTLPVTFPVLMGGVTDGAHSFVNHFRPKSLCGSIFLASETRLRM